MDIKEFFKNKKVKNILITILEILLVAGIIFGVLMFIQNKINKDGTKNSGLNSGEKQTETSKSDVAIDKYYIEINIKKSAVIVYQYSADNKTRKPYKVFNCSVGNKIKAGSFKTVKTYSWVENNGEWHKYNTQFDTKAWIQSAGYRDKYSNTLKKASYKAIGTKQKNDNSVMLYAGDAKWIFDKCGSGTELNILKGKKTDVLPMPATQMIKATKYCGWDPTDSDKDNPYKKISNGTIILGSDIVYIEKGDKPEYLSNLLAVDEDGTSILPKLKYKEISTTETGTFKLKYSVKTKSGKKLNVIQKYKVIDTTCPKVTFTQNTFTYKVDSLAEEDFIKESNIKAIENLVKAGARSDESGVEITASMPSKEELVEGDNVVVVTAKDKSGNIGSATAICKVEVKEQKLNKKYDGKKKTNSKKDSRRK